MEKLELLLDSEEAIAEHLKNLQDGVFGSQVDFAIDTAYSQVNKNRRTVEKLVEAVVVAAENSDTAQFGGRKFITLDQDDWKRITDLVPEE